MNLESIIQKTRPRIDSIIQESFAEVPAELQPFKKILLSELSAFREENLFLLPVLLGNGHENGDALFLHWGCVVELFIEALGFLDNLPSLFIPGGDTPGNQGRNDEAIHLLASDALIPQAFRILSQDDIWEEVPHDIVFKALQDLSYSVGSQGLLQGLLEQSNMERFESIEQLETIFSKKTGLLFANLARISSRLARDTELEIKQSYDFGKALGTAFPVARLMRITWGDHEREKYQTYVKFFSGLSEPDMVEFLSKYRKLARNVLDQSAHPSRKLLSRFSDSLLMKGNNHS